MQTSLPCLAALWLSLSACSPAASARAPDRRARGRRSPRLTTREKNKSRRDFKALKTHVLRKPLQSIRACRALRDLVADAYARRYWSNHYQVSHGPCPPTVAGGGRGGGSRGPTWGAPRLHFTGTNNQVAGLEESDPMQTNGTHLFVARRDHVRVVRLHPPGAGPVARIPLPRGGRAARLLLQGHRLVIIRQHGQKTTVTVVDVSVPRRPRITASWRLDGTPVQERGAGGDVLLVLRSALPIPLDFLNRVRKNIAALRPRVMLPCCGHRNLAREQARVRAWARRMLASYPVKKLLPLVQRLRGSAGPATRALVRCQDLLRSGPGARTNVVTAVVRLRLRTGRMASAGVLCPVRTVYVTPRHVYLARQRVERTRRFGCGGVARPWGFDSSRTFTRIHRLRWDGPARRPRYQASTEVPGALLNSFALDEYRGTLRVATTGSLPVTGRLASPFVSHLFVLRATGLKFGLLGGVRNLAPGERIYAVRYQGDRGYLVTFPTPRRRVRIDPFFTLELSDPRHPRVTGELKIPGFSNYLHPIGAARLLAVGEDADRRGVRHGVHLQIFDARDPRHPQRTAHYQLTQGPFSSSSRAQVDHHAFLYDPVTRVLALPLRVPAARWAGLVVFKVHPRHGFRLLGLVDHGALVARRRCPRRAADCSPYAPVTRAFLSGGFLVTVSRQGVMVHRRSAGLSRVAAHRL